MAEEWHKSAFKSSFLSKIILGYKCSLRFVQNLCNFEAIFYNKMPFFTIFCLKI